MQFKVLGMNPFYFMVFIILLLFAGYSLALFLPHIIIGLTVLAVIGVLGVIFIEFHKMMHHFGWCLFCNLYEQLTK